jgi:surface polysaccharide O-acyltransferase-like enzyme
MELPRTTRTPGRRLYLDWLRNFIVFWLIPFHAARIYDVWHPYYVTSDQSSLALSVFFGFFYAWGMELLFVVAGQASWYALGRRSRGRYLRERFHRLFIPALFGLLTLAPLMAYLGAYAHTGVFEPPLRFYAQFWRFWEPGDSYAGAFTLGHLWFIFYLFGFALLSPPIARALRSDNGRRSVGALAAWLARPGLILLLAAPVALTTLTPWLGGNSPVYYLTFYLLGFALAIDDRFNTAIDRSLPAALILGLLLMPFGFYGYAQLALVPAGPLQYELIGLGQALNSWCWVIAAIGIARRYANRAHPLLRYANRAAFPYYFLHEPVVVLCALVVVRLGLDVWAGFLLISLSALLITLGSYELLIRRLPTLRYLFGAHAPAQPRSDAAPSPPVLE